MHITSYQTNYYSIPDILVTQEKIPCIAEALLHGIGTLDPTFDKPNISRGEKIELPLWYAIHQTRLSRSRTLNFQVPDIYKSRLKEICEADALAVDLGRMNKFFYTFGQYVVPFDNSNTLAQMLYETCRARCRLLIDLSKDAARGLKNAQKFEHIESILYAIGCSTTEKHLKWLSGRAELLHTPLMVSNHQKRRRAQLDDGFDENPRLSKSPRI
ncbi:DNA replication complex GINS protein PSF3 [Sitodiplosis mosellana]|uniref:DNA replication complex GINS protein PSF3 n=1 Tax=Sitodiplosis mosellana TaxID=263140 RepID=UPI002444A273|nr:DNA replication complex GINS protein PSF3 [Sitodiplosis mosellana]